MAARYWVGGSDTWNATAGTKWSTTSGGAGGAAVPTAADEVFFDSNSGAVTIGTSGSCYCRSIDTSTFTGTFNLTVYLQIGDATSATGNRAVRFGSGMTLTGSGGLIIQSTNATAQTADLGGITLGGTFVCNGIGGTVSLASDSNVGGILVQNGTFRSENYNITGEALNSNFSYTRGIYLGSSIVTLTGTIPIGMGGVTNLTLDAGTSTIILTSTSSKIINSATSAGSLTWGNLVDSTSTGDLLIYGTNTFNNFTFYSSTGAAKTLTFASGKTKTFTGSVDIHGSASNKVTINSNSAGTAATLSKTSGTVICEYLSIKDSTAAGGATWYAGGGSTDVSNNSGWIFSAGGTTTSTSLSTSSTSTSISTSTSTSISTSSTSTSTSFSTSTSTSTSSTSTSTTQSLTTSTSSTSSSTSISSTSSSTTQSTSTSTSTSSTSTSTSLSTSTSSTSTSTSSTSTSISTSTSTTIPPDPREKGYIKPQAYKPRLNVSTNNPKTKRFTILVHRVNSSKTSPRHTVKRVTISQLNNNKPPKTR